VDGADEAALRALLAAQPIGALGTLRAPAAGRGAAGDGGLDAEPVVSMVPVAWLPGRAQALIHVSALSPHTRDLLERPRVSLMLVAPRSAGDNPLALARVTLQADAARIAPGTAEHEAARAAYLARFAEAAQTFELADFSLFVLAPRAVRFIAGFGRAHAVALTDWTRIAAG
jgi:heme iron utilization protein